MLSSQHRGASEHPHSIPYLGLICWPCRGKAILSRQSRSPVWVNIEPFSSHIKWCDLLWQKMPRRTRIVLLWCLAISNQRVAMIRPSRETSYRLSQDFLDRLEVRYDQRISNPSQAQNTLRADCRSVHRFVHLIEIDLRQSLETMDAPMWNKDSSNVLWAQEGLRLFAVQLGLHHRMFFVQEISDSLCLSLLHLESLRSLNYF